MLSMIALAAANSARSHAMYASLWSAAGGQECCSDGDGDGDVDDGDGDGDGDGCGCDGIIIIIPSGAFEA